MIFRRLRSPDLPAIARLLDTVFVRKTSLMPDYAYVYERKNLHRCWGAFAGNTPVAHCAARRGDIETLGIRIGWAAFGNVCTRPEWRGKGIGSRLMALCHAGLRHEGVNAVYISGGRGLYTRVGATPAGDLRSVIIRGAPPTSGGGLRVLSGSEAAARLASLHVREPVRFLRAASDLRSVLATGFTHDVPVRSYALGSAVAVVGPEWGTPVRRGGAIVAHDVAGEPVDIVRLLHAVRARLGARRLWATIPAWNTELLSALGGDPKPAGVPGTILLLEPAKLLSNVRAFLPGAEWRKAPRDRAALTRWLFGDGRGAPARIPLPAIGLNYM